VPGIVNAKPMACRCAVQAATLTTTNAI
jgi:hypothetical protein